GGRLALQRSRVARRQAGAVGWHALLRIGPYARARDPVAYRARLAARAAAVHADPHVEGALDACQLQRRERELTVRRAWEVALDRPAVEPGRAVAGLEDHARHRGLAFPGSSVLSEHVHVFSSSSFGACA